MASYLSARLVLTQGRKCPRPRHKQLRHPCPPLRNYLHRPGEASHSVPRKPNQRLCCSLLVELPCTTREQLFQSSAGNSTRRRRMNRRRAASWGRINTILLLPMLLPAAATSGACTPASPRRCGGTTGGGGSGSPRGRPRVILPGAVQVQPSPAPVATPEAERSRARGSYGTGWGLKHHHTSGRWLRLEGDILGGQCLELRSMSSFAMKEEPAPYDNISR